VAQLQVWWEDLILALTRLFYLNPNERKALPPPEVRDSNETPPAAPPVLEERKQVAIIGAGISGLVCARALLSNNITDFVLLEKRNEVGGRVRTEVVDGYLLDRGFQARHA
jgi:NADPH-dependent 2,4-dienoyl-CoA reductase/sulfur reductase-like enzyme